MEGSAFSFLAVARVVFKRAVELVFLILAICDRRSDLWVMRSTVLVGCCLVDRLAAPDQQTPKHLSRGARHFLRSSSLSANSVHLFSGGHRTNARPSCVEVSRATEFAFSSCTRFRSFSLHNRKRHLGSE